MLDLLRERRVFMALVGVLVATAGMLYTLGARHARTVQAAQPPLRDLTPKARPAAVAHAAAAGTPSSPVPPLRGARTAARRFLTSWLPYSYGHGGTRGIRAATDTLRRTLSSNPPRVPPGERRHHPRIRQLETEAATADTAVARAVVADGAQRYVVELELVRAGGWRVARVG